MDVENDNINKDVSYKPGTFRYHDLPMNKRKKYFNDRQRELNPCLEVRAFI